MNGHIAEHRILNGCGDVIPMTVNQYMLDKIAKGTIHAALIDPDKQPAEKAGEIARTMKEAGSDIIFVGGSSGITMENLSATAKAVKEASGLPVILFGGTPDSLNKELDAVFFMQIVNAADPRFVTFGQVAAAQIGRASCRERV